MGFAFPLSSIIHRDKGFVHADGAFIKNKIVYIGPAELWCPTGKWLCGACVRFLLSEGEGMGGTADEDK